VTQPITEGELFFRRVLLGRGYAYQNGELRISSQAFADRECEPSVDRELLCRDLGGAAFTQQVPENGVLTITAAAVRGINIEHAEAKKEPAHFVADLDPRPIAGNPAHHVIRLVPTTDKKGVFKKLIERLPQLAKWEILPRDVREGVQ
jgi:hypothetical protein